MNNSHFTYRFSMTGTSTACKVFGRRRDPGFNAPHPAAHPNLPKKSSFFSGKQIGATQYPPWTKCYDNRVERIGQNEREKTHQKIAKKQQDFWNRRLHSTHTDMRHQMHGSFKCEYRNIKTIGLRCEFEVWMHIDFSYTKCVCW